MDYQQSIVHNEQLVCASMYVVSFWMFCFKSHCSCASPLPHKSRNWINSAGGIWWHGGYKERRCRVATMRHGWIYVEPLWYIQLSDRRRQTVRSAEKKALSCHSGWTLTNVLHTDIRNSSCIPQNVTYYVCFICVAFVKLLWCHCTHSVAKLTKNPFIYYIKILFVCF